MKKSKRSHSGLLRLPPGSPAMAALSILALVTSSLLFFAVRPPPLAAAAHPLELSSFSAADSPWLPSQNRTLLSPNGTFAAGFLPSSTACAHSPSSPAGYLFSVWVPAAADRTVAWSLGCRHLVASTSPLVLSSTGALSLNDSSGRNLWPGSPGGGPNATRLELSDGGELALGSWSSFDHPTDTVLPNQALQGRNLTSSNGRYQFANATTLVFNGSDSYWSPKTLALKYLTPDGFLFKENGETFVMADVGERPLRRITLDPDGNLRAYSLDTNSGNWSAVWQAVQERCRIHGTCGPNSICYSNGSTLTGFTCVCPPGFRWSRGGSGGCEPKAPPLRGGSKFLRMDFVSFDGGANATPLTLAACRSRCLTNASCVGFTYKFTGQQDCYHYAGALANGIWSPSTEATTFLRVASSETAVTNFTGMEAAMDTVCAVRVSLPLPPNETKTTARNLGIIGTAFALELLAGVLAFWALLRRYSKYRDMARVLGLEFLPAGGPKRFSYAELRAATADFSDVIGQGGFGVVYKGVLPDRRAVAVKRLRGVTGSEADFWAEVTIIARMHHLNLVRLWGFCAEKDQRLLVYEYVPNGSLDKYLFPQSEEDDDETPTQEEDEAVAPVAGRRRRPVLDWGIRYRIAVGVARAIAYLHEECLEWVLHRDIKPENILLDSDFCPKVSDFGLAKLTGGKGEERVSRSGVAPRGTQGYIAPEWVMPREAITAKVDVYSFGMVLLEMVTGARGSECRRASVGSEEWYLPGFAYEKVFAERSVEEVLDRRILGSYDSRAHAAKVERMVKTAMWCLQGRPEQRPSMGKVAKMLEGTVEITEPGKPTIFYLRDN